VVENIYLVTHTAVRRIERNAAAAAPGLGHDLGEVYGSGVDVAVVMMILNIQNNKNTLEMSFLLPLFLLLLPLLLFLFLRSRSPGIDLYSFAGDY
jgi:hypothetical protein